MNDKRPFDKVAVLMGGVSAEREVSLRSGAAVARGLAEAGYQATAVDVTAPALDLPAGTEAVFIALHGEFGEDGQVQAMLDRAGIPYTGSGADASRCAFDKILSKTRFAEAGIPTPAWAVAPPGQPPPRPLPLVVKPARQGSSFGVHCVREAGQWQAALRDAGQYGCDVLAEDYVPGRELTVGIVGDTALPVIEIVAENDWYDYTAKYTKGRTAYRPPPGLAPDAQADIQRLALAAFHALGCRGFGRADFRLTPDGRPYALEMNTVPGFTETSLLPKAAAWTGLSFAALCDAILRLATV